MRASIGATITGPADPPSGAAALLARADRQLYDAKCAGRDRVHLERPTTPRPPAPLPRSA